MEKMENRRRSKRHPARWTVAVVLDKADGKPVILHTHSLDLSLGGVAVVTEQAERAGTEVTVLLAQPPEPAGKAPKIVKARARVISAAQAPSKTGYRLGLNFVEWTDDGHAMLAGLLNAIEAGRPQPARAAPQAAPAEVTPPAAGSRLARLKELAQAKLSDQEKTDLQEENNERVDAALKRAFQYLKELAEQLNVVKPAFKGYTIVGVSEFTGLAWVNGRADFRTRDISPTKRLYERVMLSFRLSANKQIRVAHISPASDKLRQVLKENKIEFTAEETRNDRGALERTTFAITCEVTAGVLLEGNFDSGRIQLRLNNVARFGILDYQLLPEAITEEALEDFTGFLLGENHDIGLLIKNGA